ncbi:MAG TPA: type IV pilus modification protein PilV [Steroidobacteraceae bacterium]|jgi:type IV pilus assembly protein PilV|nr:type IV pilus modification protein PilV [Steroidobacteraceae bacterium]
MKSLHRKDVPARSRARGFTLLEVMVALIITAIGMLGIAKIQALAYASTGSASIRSLVALQAAGLAASMHANRGYWASGAAPVLITITGTSTSTTISDTTLNTTATTANFCVAGSGNTPCLGPTMAAFDLHTYSLALNSMLGNSNPVTTITCPIAIPINCTIQVTWNEKAVSINNQSVAGTTQTTFAPNYTLFVEP